MNRFEAFRALHRAGPPRFPPDARDRAAALAARGFPAIGTTPRASPPRPVSRTRRRAP